MKHLLLMFGVGLLVACGGCTATDFLDSRVSVFTRPV